MSKQSSASKIAGGLGVAALAAASAAAYYFSGSEGKKRQAKVISWAEAAKKDMVAKIKQMKSVSQKTYGQAAKEVLAKYRQAKNIKPEELAAFGIELKKHWDKISKDVKKMGSVKPTAKKAQGKKKK